MNTDKEFQLKKYYSLLMGMEDNMSLYDQLIPEEVVKQYNKILIKIYEIIKDDIILDYKINDWQVKKYNIYSEDEHCDIYTFYSKLTPILRYLKENYIDDNISKIGTLYSTIEDEELKKRCLDILSSKDAFDRVINQATQVLEDRIKKKAKLEKEKLVGLNLVSKAIAAKKENTILLFSEEPEIQESYSMLYKGVIGTLRNPTHHSTDYMCTREQALKCCAFIDYLLKELKYCKVLEKINS